MKVSTDAMLFGSWCNPKNAQRILDIGTGTGLLSLILAQRATDNAQITAIEIDADAAQQAKENIALSPWSQQIQVHHRAFQDYCLAWQSQNSPPFDLIVSNPPWYEYSGSSSHNQDNQHREFSRTLARQQIGLTLSELIENSLDMLSEDGEIYLVLPTLMERPLLSLVQYYKLRVSSQCDVKATSVHKAHCQMWRLAKDNLPCQIAQSDWPKDTIVIREANNGYSTHFKSICRDYYLNF